MRMWKAGKSVSTGYFPASLALHAERQSCSAGRGGSVWTASSPARESKRYTRTPKRSACDGQAASSHRAFVYLMLHKPAGILSASRDAARATVADLVPAEFSHRALFPVGRLDKDTTGLLLLTDDGDTAHRLLSPRRHVEKVYEALLDGPLPDGALEAFREGMVLADGSVCPTGGAVGGHAGGQAFGAGCPHRGDVPSDQADVRRTWPGGGGAAPGSPWGLWCSRSHWPCPGEMPGADRRGAPPASGGCGRGSNRLEHCRRLAFLPSLAIGRGRCQKARAACVGFMGTGRWLEREALWPRRLDSTQKSGPEPCKIYTNCLFCRENYAKAPLQSLVNCLTCNGRGYLL